MPHIVLDGKADIEAFWRSYAPLQERTPDGNILKTAECWLNERRTAVLIDSLTIEKGISRRFYALVSDKGDRCTLHLEGLTQPVATDSVKQLLAFLAAELRRRFPALTYGKTNLPEFLRP